MAAVVARALGKRFSARDPGAARTFRQYVEWGWRQRRRRGAFWALRDVSFEVAQGEMLGVVGRNGSGKSTLLRLLGGVMRPDEGAVETQAPVTGLLDLNAGMHPDLSGRDNAVISGVVQGLLRSEVERRLDEIFAFAELEAFADAPFRTYSSGMRLRLGFAVMAHAEPRILLIDEVLAVGDLAFQRRCLDRVQRFRDEGCAVVLISHDLAQVESICDRAVWLDSGRTQRQGEPEPVVQAYRAEMMAETARRAPPDAPEAVTAGGVRLRMGENRHGSLEVEITGVRILDAAGRETDAIPPGAALTIEIALLAPGGPLDAHVSVTITQPSGVVCLQVGTGDDAMEPVALTGERTIALRIDRLDLAPGLYSITLAVWHPSWSHAFDLHVAAYRMTISGDRPRVGMLSPPRRWSLA